MSNYVSLKNIQSVYDEFGCGEGLVKMKGGARITKLWTIAAITMNYSRRQKKVVIPAKAGIQFSTLFFWIPTFVGMTRRYHYVCLFMTFTIEPDECRTMRNKKPMMR